MFEGSEFVDTVLLPLQIFVNENYMSAKLLNLENSMIILTSRISSRYLVKVVSRSNFKNVKSLTNQKRSLEEVKTTKSTGKEESKSIKK